MGSKGSALQLTTPASAAEADGSDTSDAVGLQHRGTELL
jgi:hypothetical protein